MLYGILADAVMVAHLAFILFVATGSLLALRWRWLVWAHLPALVWGVGTVTIGFACPLTALETSLRRLAGGEPYEGGFVDRYLEGVVYPEEYTVVLRALVLAAVVAGYLALSRTGGEHSGAGQSWRWRQESH